MKVELNSKDSQILKFLDFVPEKYKVGPWHPIAHLTILSMISFVLLTMPGALESMKQAFTMDIEADFYVQSYRLVFALYALGISIGVLVVAGPFLFCSYTLTSWNLLTLRMIFSWLAGFGFEWCGVVANAVRFPALVGCTITVVVWWTAIVPLIYYLLRNSENEYKFFHKFNKSFVLINIHLLNLPIVAFEFMYNQQQLVFFDLWMGIVVGVIYMIFYLNVLDPMGLHFYIIFTPRTHWCALTYSLIFVLYTGIYLAWNSALSLVAA